MKYIIFYDLLLFYMRIVYVIIINFNIKKKTTNKKNMLNRNTCFSFI